jgi:hypothetical protein
MEDVKKRRSSNKQRIRADEVFQYGSLTIARYGRFVQFSNNSTPEEHKQFLERAKKAHSETKSKLEEEVIAAQSLIAQYDPVELMHRVAYMVLPLFIKYRSENEFSPDESYALPTLEYIQYLIARTPLNADPRKLSETEFEKLWNKAFEVMKLTQTYLITRAPENNPPTEIDSLRHMLDSKRLMVRVKRYPTYLSDYLRASLEPYNEQIQEVYGVNVDEIIKGIEQINDYQKNGVTGRYKETILASASLMEQLSKQGLKIGKGARKEDKEKVKQALQSKEFKKQNDEAQEKARLTFTPAIFDITELTSLPKNILSLLSVKPGESILQTLTGPDHDDLSPLSPSALHHKPFLEIDGKFYTFYHSGFEDHMAEIIEADLLEKLPSKKAKMETAKSDNAELISTQLLSSLIDSDFVLQNVYYPNPEQKGNLTELDILIGADDVLFLVEVKSGGFTGGASRGAPKDLASTLSDLIIAGQKQSERAEKYIKSDTEVKFFDKSGKIVVQTIQHSNYRKIFRVVITREDLGWVGAKLAQLSILDPTLSESLPWHVSIDDLRVVVDLFSDSDVRFIHYLEQRLAAGSEEKLAQHDEIEHVGLYNKINHYQEFPVEGVGRIHYDASYMRDIDYYFASKNSGENPEPPIQDMPQRMKQLISTLTDSKISRRFELGSSILMLDSEGRQQLDKALETLEKGESQGRQITLRLPITSHSYGMSFTVAKDNNWENELLRSAAQMELGNCSWWLVVQLQTTAEYKVLRIEKITPGRFSEEELALGRAAIERKAQETISIKKVGRNEKCPCGSGKKYKKCHGGPR